MKKKAVIIGGGPAGLTAAHELLATTDIHPVVFEKGEMFGGIARTENYKGNRIDIGGHRFFSKSDRVMDFWRAFLPVQGYPAQDEIKLGVKKREEFVSDGPDPEKTNNVMLIRSRLSRIFYLRKFFDYPVTLSKNTLLNLGIVRVARIGFSYIKIRLFPRKEENSLEDFFINRFGVELYKTFFKDYTEKVWGIPCTKIKAEWGAQRIKGLSVTKTVLHALRSVLPKRKSIEQKDTETSLIETFLYPKLGPGQMWESVAQSIIESGGETILNSEIVRIKLQGKKVVSVTVKDRGSGKEESVPADYIFSTMPIKELITSMEGSVPERVHTLAKGLEYRDFMTAGLLLNKLKIKNETNIKTVGNIIPDNWIYIQEPDVKVGRLQFFNNWSPYLVSNANKVWIGMEYFASEGDKLWSMSDEAFLEFAKEELAKIGISDESDVVDGVVIRAPKAYPSYTGEGYDHFSEIRDFCDSIENLYLIGRNGMHKYNNQDHSMLSAFEAVRHIRENLKTKENIWNVNAEKEYHEEKSS